MSAQIDSIQKFLLKAVEDNPEYISLKSWLPYIIINEDIKDSIELSFSDQKIGKLFSDDVLGMFEKIISDYSDKPVKINYTGNSKPLFKLTQSPVNKNKIFDDFYSGPSSRLAFAAAKSITTENNVDYNPFYVYGSTGLGKSHLLQAIYNGVNDNSSSLSVIYMNADDYLNNFYNAVENSCLDEFYNEIVSFNILIIEDFHKFSDNQAAQEYILKIFDTFHENKKQIVISADKSPDKIEILDERLLTRLKWGLAVEIEKPTKILYNQFILKESGKFNLDIPADVRDYLASSPIPNIMEMQGILNNVHSRAKLLQEPVTMDLVQKIVVYTNESSCQMITSDHIIGFISNHFGISKEILLSQTRTRSIAYPRQIAMYLAYTMTSLSLQDIGEIFGGRDHSTVKHACDKIKSQLTTDYILKNIVDEFKKSMSITC